MWTDEMGLEKKKKKPELINSNDILIRFHNSLLPPPPSPPPSSPPRLVSPQQPSIWIFSPGPLGLPITRAERSRPLKQDHLTLISQTGKHLRHALIEESEHAHPLANKHIETDGANGSGKTEKKTFIWSRFVYVFLWRGDSFRQSRK